ncbi:hypothetical protein BST11_22340, partial [Mycobacterium alsense]
SGGFAPPPPGPAIRALPTESYTPWLTRVLAYIVDNIPVAILIGIGSLVQALTTQQTCTSESVGYSVSQNCVPQTSAMGMLVFWIAWLAAMAYLVWNYGYRQGTTGSSVGKSLLKFKVVSEVTGQPIGFGMSVVRQIAHFVDGIICYIGYLFPLWDAKRQTLADKIMTTVCLPMEET